MINLPVTGATIDLDHPMKSLFCPPIRAPLPFMAPLLPNLLFPFFAHKTPPFAFFSNPSQPSSLPSLPNPSSSTWTKPFFLSFPTHISSSDFSLAISYSMELLFPCILFMMES